MLKKGTSEERRGQGIYQSNNRRESALFCSLGNTCPHQRKVNCVAEVIGGHKPPKACQPYPSLLICDDNVVFLFFFWNGHGEDRAHTFPSGISALTSDSQALYLAVGRRSGEVCGPPLSWNTTVGGPRADGPLTGQYQGPAYSVEAEGRLFEISSRYSSVEKSRTSPLKHTYLRNQHSFVKPAGMGGFRLHYQ